MFLTTKCKVCGLDYYSNRTKLDKQDIKRVIQKSCQKLHVSLSMSEVNSIMRIMKRESDFSVVEKNKHSSAYGLGQLLHETYLDLHAKRSRCYFCQTMLMIKYIKSRYHTPTRALAFHLSRGYY